MSHKAVLLLLSPTQHTCVSLPWSLAFGVILHLGTSKGLTNMSIYIMKIILILLLLCIMFGKPLNIPHLVNHYIDCFEFHI